MAARKLQPPPRPPVFDPWCGVKVELGQVRSPDALPLTVKSFLRSLVAGSVDSGDLMPELRVTPLDSDGNEGDPRIYDLDEVGSLAELFVEGAKAGQKLAMRRLGLLADEG